MTAAGLSSAAEEMFNMPAKTSGVARYRQDRTIAFMVSSIAVASAGKRSSLLPAMLSGLLPAQQGVQVHA
jgi:hypothetical protein